MPCGYQTDDHSDRQESDEEGEKVTDQESVGVIVLGAGRSGTSGIARAFVKAGFFAGADGDVLGPAESNPVGHYEPLPVLELNESLLRELGRSWWADAPASEEQLTYRADVISRLKGVLDGLIASANGAPVVVKEPRINSLLPLWQPVIEGILHPVLALRDPAEVALSHAHRDGISVSHALATWETQTTAALRWLNGRVATIAPYGQLSTQPEVAGKIVRDATAHIDSRRAEQVRPMDAGSAVEPSLRRQSADNLDHTEYLTGRQSQLWGHLKDLTAGDAQLEIPARLLQPNVMAQGAIQKEGERVQMLVENESLGINLSSARGQVRALERQLAEATAHSEQVTSVAEGLVEEIGRIKESASWRLTAPLRGLKHRFARAAAER
jgi:hypothetical protein